ncbi:RNA pseudouridylate synthase domain-containing protein 3 [Biomphalaria glabrata]|uniref:Pseudouridine synthase RsuA/RluA-like domain-containing protein n=1 Tax=Biomphalaria glabrata TaxID=6526 RepID=A0A2C9M6C1_BIOGL|nr:RNA pseudouridylate synthase domain-containing protein 3 [Biomphalaria glabrata]
MQKLNLMLKILRKAPTSTWSWSTWSYHKRHLSKSRRTEINKPIDLLDDTSSQEIYCNHNTKKESLKTSQTADLILQNIVFENDAIVAVNKPLGISAFGKKSVLNCSNTESNLESIQQCLPLLSERLKCPGLGIGLSLKSYHQGLLLLCKDKKIKTKLDDCLTQMAIERCQFLTYLAVTVGIPTCPPNTPTEIYIQREYLHDREISVVTSQGSVTARKKGLMILSKFTVKPLMVNTDLNVALLEISINKDKWDAVESLLSYYLSPILGDDIYSSRVYTINGIPFASSPYVTKPKLQELPSSVVNVLTESGLLTQEKRLPLFLHRHKVMVNRFPNSKSPPLVITSKPHDYFLQVLQSLGLYNANIV